MAQRREGKPLASTIVQRLQRYSAENAFKRTILDMITNGGYRCAICLLSVHLSCTWSHSSASSEFMTKGAVLWRVGAAHGLQWLSASVP